MALSILDGNQSATTLSTILSSGQHITAHTVVSLGTQAITDIVNATSAGLTNTQLRASAVTVGGTVRSAVAFNVEGDLVEVADNNPFPISGTVNIGSALLTGTNRIGVVTIGAGTVTIGAGTAQIGSVTASISNSVVTFYPMQGTSVSSTNFTSTATTTLVSAVAGREVLTVFNEGAGNLHISAGASCTTTAYQVRLSSGDYWECPAGQTSLVHTAIFATAGTARVTQVS